MNIEFCARAYTLHTMSCRYTTDFAEIVDSARARELLTSGELPRAGAIKPSQSYRRRSCAICRPDKQLTVAVTLVPRVAATDWTQHGKPWGGLYSLAGIEAAE